MEKIKLFLLTGILAGGFSVSAGAYDFSAKNSTKATIYYNITSEAEKTCEVTFKNSDSYNSYYSSNLVIPSTVDYNGETYTVTSIGYNAFKGCNDLEAVTLPSTIKTIEQCFEGCTVLTKIHVDNLSFWLNLESQYGYGLQSPVSLIVNGKELTDLVVPAGVKSIRNYAFSNIKLNSVNLNEVETVGTAAFSHCGLKNVYQTKLTKIEDSGFSNNPSINIDLNNIEYVGSWAFYVCGFNDLTLPESLKYYGSGAFVPSYYSGKYTLRVKDYKHWCSIQFEYNPMDNYCDVYIGETLLNELRDLDLPEDVTEIGDYCFANCVFRTVTLDDNVTKIGEKAFFNCKYLRSLYIGPNVEVMGAGAFQGCEVLEDLEMHSAGKIIEEYAFYGCSSLESIEIPEGVEEIKSGAFFLNDYSSTHLQTVKFPASLKRMQYNAFGYVDNVDIADIAAWCEGSYNFYNHDHWWVRPNLLVNGVLVSDLVIPEGVKKIQDYAFAGFKNLTSVTLPESIEEIGYGAFISDNIATFNFPKKTDYKIKGASFNAQAWLDTQPDVIYINNKLYHVKKNVKDLVIEDGTEEIIMYCMILTTMHNYDHEVESITIPSSVNLIHNCAFIELSNLKKIIFKGAYTNIYMNAEGDMALYVFDMCPELKEIYYNGTFNENLSHMFAGTEEIDFYVPNIYVEDFKNNWDTSNYWANKKHFYPMNRSYDLTVSAAEMATLWLDFDATIPNGVEVYYAEDFDKSKSNVMMQKITGEVLPRETGVIVKGEAGNYTFCESDTEGTAVSSLLVGSAAAETFGNDGFKYYKLSYDNDGENLGFYLANSEGTIESKPNKAYLKLPASPSSAPTRSIGISFGDENETTGIEEINAEDAVLPADGSMFDLNGKAVGSGYKGIAVKNGKKVLMK